MFEIHYQNPEKISGQVDSSGIRIKTTEKLRDYDAAVMELGVEYEDVMAVPPQSVAFPLSGYCTSDCTKSAFPKTGITIIGSQLHMHERGVRGKK